MYKTIFMLHEIIDKTSEIILVTWQRTTTIWVCLNMDAVGEYWLDWLHDNRRAEQYLIVGMYKTLLM